MTKSYCEVKRRSCTPRSGSDISERVALHFDDPAPRQAGIVVIGGGIAGASVAHHLALLGRTDVVIVDQGPLWETGGSTSHAPGLVFQHNASKTMTGFARETVELLGGLELDGL